MPNYKFRVNGKLLDYPLEIQDNEETHLVVVRDGVRYYDLDNAPNLVYVGNTENGERIFESSIETRIYPENLGDSKKRILYLNNLIEQNRDVLRVAQEIIDEFEDQLSDEQNPETMLGVMEIIRDGEKQLITANSGGSPQSYINAVKKLQKARKTARKTYDEETEDLKKGTYESRTVVKEITIPLSLANSKLKISGSMLKHLNCAAPRLLDEISEDENIMSVVGGHKHEMPKAFVVEIWFSRRGGNFISIRGVRYHHLQVTPSCWICEHNLRLLAFRKVAGFMQNVHTELKHLAKHGQLRKRLRHVIPEPRQRRTITRKRAPLVQRLLPSFKYRLYQADVIFSHLAADTRRKVIGQYVRKHGTSIRQLAKTVEDYYKFFDGKSNIADTEYARELFLYEAALLLSDALPRLAKILREVAPPKGKQNLQARQALFQYAQRCNTCGDNIRELNITKLLAPPDVEPPPKPRPLPSVFKTLAAEIISWVNRVDVLFSNLTWDLSKKRQLTHYVSRNARIRLHEFWRRVRSDAVFLKNATRPFNEKGARAYWTDEAIELKIREVIAYLEPEVDAIHNAVSTAFKSNPHIDKRIRVTLNSYQNRLKHARGLLDLQKRMPPPPEDQTPLKKGEVRNRPLWKESNSTPMVTDFPVVAKTSKSRVALQLKEKVKGHGQHCYNDDEIDVLLQHYLPLDQIYIMRGIDAHLHGGETIEDNIREAFNRVLGTGIRMIAIPVHVGHNHWTALSIRFDLNSLTPYIQPQIQYADPMGTRSIPSTLRLSLRRVFRNPRFSADNTTAYQTDEYNCGPWTVELLRYMGEHNGVLPGRNTIDIAERRIQHAQVLQ